MSSTLRPSASRGSMLAGKASAGRASVFSSKSKAEQLTNTCRGHTCLIYIYTQIYTHHIQSKSYNISYTHYIHILCTHCVICIQRYIHTLTFLACKTYIDSSDVARPLDLCLQTPRCRAASHGERNQVGRDGGWHESHEQSPG